MTPTTAASSLQTVKNCLRSSRLRTRGTAPKTLPTPRVLWHVCENGLGRNVCSAPDRTHALQQCAEQSCRETITDTTSHTTVPAGQPESTCGSRCTNVFGAATEAPLFRASMCAFLQPSVLAKPREILANTGNKALKSRVPTSDINKTRGFCQHSPNQAPQSAPAAKHSDTLRL